MPNHGRSSEHFQRTLSQPLAQSTKDIFPAPERLRNAAMGMAISWEAHLRSRPQPLKSMLRNGASLCACLAHIFAPLTLAWFSSHWNVRMEAAIWSGSAIAMAAAFAALWLTCLMVWSMCWIGAAACVDRVKRLAAHFASVGEGYLVSKRIQEGSSARLDS